MTTVYRRTATAQTTARRSFRCRSLDQKEAPTRTQNAGAATQITQLFDHDLARLSEALVAPELGPHVQQPDRHEDGRDEDQVVDRQYPAADVNSILFLLGPGGVRRRVGQARHLAPRVVRSPLIQLNGRGSSKASPRRRRGRPPVADDDLVDRRHASRSLSSRRQPIYNSTPWRHHVPQLQRPRSSPGRHVLPAGDDALVARRHGRRCSPPRRPPSPSRRRSSPRRSG